MKKYLKILTGIILVMLLLGGFYFGTNHLETESKINKVDTAMGTVISQTLFVKGNQSKETGADITEAIMNTIRDIEETHLSWRLESSEIYKINEFVCEEDTESKHILPSAELMNMLLHCQEISKASEGAFDISLGSLIRLWNIDSLSSQSIKENTLPIPTELEIQEALQNIGWQQIILRDKELLIPKDMKLDLGAVGKGAALDFIYQMLSADYKDRLTGAVISVGGSILTYGDKPDGSLWRVGIVNPFNTEVNIGYLSLQGDWCVSTSGDYERYVEVNKKRYHHILNPETGYPAENGVHSVTILSKSGLLSDALSTACFILGEEQGTRLAQKFQSEVLFILEDGRMSMTEGIRQLFTEVK